MLVPYGAAGVAACAAAAFYVPDPVRAMGEAALEIVASIGVLLPAWWTVKPTSVLMPLPPVRQGGRWIGAVAVALVVFSTLLGHGIR